MQIEDSPQNLCEWEEWRKRIKYSSCPGNRVMKESNVCTQKYNFSEIKTSHKGPFN